MRLLKNRHPAKPEGLLTKAPQTLVRGDLAFAGTVRMYKIAALIMVALHIIIAAGIAAAVSAETVCADSGHRYTVLSRREAEPASDGAIRYRCGDCGHEYTEILFATDHLWGEWVIDIAPTCTAEGTRRRTCTRGQEHVESAAAPALGHEYAGAVTTAPGCEAAGVTTLTCIRCGDSYTEEIPATGHDYYEEITKKPSCFEDGLKSFICANDGAHTYTEPLPAHGEHDFGEWYEETPASADEGGVQARICARDGYSETQETPPLTADGPPPEAPVINAADVALTGTNVALAGIFAFLILPYIKCIIYIRKRCRIVRRLKELREMVEKAYDFK